MKVSLQFLLLLASAILAAIVGFGFAAEPFASKIQTGFFVVLLLALTWLVVEHRRPV